MPTRAVRMPPALLGLAAAAMLAVALIAGAAVFAGATDSLAADSTGTISGEVMVATVPAAGVPVAVPRVGLGTKTDASGHYSIREIPPGRYLLMVFGLARGVASDSVLVVAGDTTRVPRLDLDPSRSERIAAGDTMGFSRAERESLWAGYGCPVHRDVRLRADFVRIGSGQRIADPDLEMNGRWYFPYARDEVRRSSSRLGGEPRYARVLFCPRCRELELEFILKRGSGRHIHWGP